MFSKAQHGTDPGDLFGPRPSFSGVKASEGALRTVKNGPEWSRMVTWRLLGRLAGSPGTVLRDLFRVSEGPERVHGVPRGFMGSPKLGILSFLQFLWCDLHVFQGPTWDRLRVGKFIETP